MASELSSVPPDGQLLIYQDGDQRVKVRIDGQTVWLTQRELAALYQTSVPNINQHLSSIYEEGELQSEATIKKYLIVQTEGARQISRQVEHYNLAAILAVGYRVRSARGTQFRMWATQRLQEYIVKGFAMDDERLKAAGGGGYFEELLERIRDIRSSERMFWKKVLDIYATSIDYDPRADSSQLFFQTVQNKMHWAISGQTAAVIIHKRADALKPNMGLTQWAGDRPRRADVCIAKNYLSGEELRALNLMVSAYLDFAELQAVRRKPMTMADWIAKLDDFIRISDREILTHAGRISHEAARLKAEEEFERFRGGLPDAVDQHFAEAVEELKQIEAATKKKTSSSPKKRSK